MFPCNLQEDMFLYFANISLCTVLGSLFYTTWPDGFMVHYVIYEDKDFKLLREGSIEGPVEVICDTFPSVK